MYKIPLRYANVGMILGRSIIDSEGKILLRAGVKLEERYIRRLEELDMHYIYIRSDDLGDCSQPEDVICEETRIKTIKLVKNTFSQLQNQRKINTAALRNIVNNLLDEIMDNSHVLLGISDMATLDNVMFYHSISVCTLSIMTGITLGYNDTSLRDLGIGALLHDIGKSRIDPEILKRQSDLSEEDHEELSKHPELGFAIFRESGDLPLLSAHVAYQHHERWDGKGYPRRLVGQDIHEYARIVAVANTYDELMTDRPNRPSYQVNQAITVIKRLAGIYFDPDIVTAMIANIACYPLGCFIKLNSGEIGIVFHVNAESPQKPIVRIIFDRFMRRVHQPYEIDLARMNLILPIEVINEQEIYKLLPRQA